jgi:hypothetical protein
MIIFGLALESFESVAARASDPDVISVHQP